MLGTVGFAFLAGLLSVLSPCVLPLVPIVLGTAASEHRLGPVALASGLAIAFTTIGLFVATIGFAIGLDGDVFRRAGAILLVILGVVLMLPRLQAQVATAAGPVGAWAEERFAGIGTGGLSGQFTVGVVGESLVEMSGRAPHREAEHRAVHPGHRQHQERETAERRRPME